MATGTAQALSSIGMTGLVESTTNCEAMGWSAQVSHTKDVGYVTADVKLVVFIANGSTASASLSEITGNDDAEGITWDVEPPDTISALTSERIVITVTTTGLLEYEALLTFVSSCLLDPELTIVGTRAPQLAGDVGYLFWPHNWTDGMDESLSWKTEILTAHDRTEQRIRQRTTPRRTWDIRLTVAGNDRRKLEQWLASRMKRHLFLPVWRDLSAADAEVTSGDSVVYVETAGFDYAVDRWLAIWDGSGNREIRTITGIGATYVSVDAPFNNDWPAGSFVAPCRYGYGVDQRRLSRFTEEVATYHFTVEAQNETEMEAIDTPELYRSVMVCPLTPSWVGDATETIDNFWDRLDNETGLVEFDIRSVEPIFGRSVSFLLIGREKIDLFLRFLFTCCGRLAPFWLASTGRDFELAATAAVDATEIIIENIDYEYSLSGSAARSHIELVTTDGAVIRRMITAIATLPDGTEQLTIDSGLSQGVSAATLNRCSWLELVRLDSDDIDIHWVDRNCLQVTVPIVVLP